MSTCDTDGKELADLPLGLVVPDGATAQEGVTQGDPGAPLGRELEFAHILRTAHRAGVTGIVLLTADVHYTAAHHYDSGGLPRPGRRAPPPEGI